MKILLLLAIIVCTTASQAATLTVKVTNIKSNRGKIMLALYDQSQGFPSDYNRALENRIVRIEEAQNVKFENLRKNGYYALAIFHDENSDNNLNTNAMGIPTEGFGFSNNPKILFGPPKFSKAKIKMSSDKNTTIILKHF